MNILRVSIVLYKVFSLDPGSDQRIGHQTLNISQFYRLELRIYRKHLSIHQFELHTFVLINLLAGFSAVSMEEHLCLIISAYIGHLLKLNFSPIIRKIVQNNWNTYYQLKYRNKCYNAVEIISSRFGVLIWYFRWNTHESRNKYQQNKH